MRYVRLNLWREVGEFGIEQQHTAAQEHDVNAPQFTRGGVSVGEFGQIAFIHLLQSSGGAGNLGGELGSGLGHGLTMREEGDGGKLGGEKMGRGGG
jgi:hypothetical protein